ncbi:MAG TPA: hypothetical protein P5244_15800 [Syntrophales bacterium]|jgi:putative sterol carrier protein|nr:hypothetical protein [Deltaproteobacteria bacterium]HQI01680.1 hypothetical protein [Deltaproteobacteria bacterium]HQJ08472.1 hypothetical protein [Deltaproteobacteria bacterium]HRR42695.1 hypothetical protein [Syntrophales bacterium]
MPVFKSTEHLYETLGSFWKYLYERDDFSGGLKSTGIQIKFEISDPPAIIWAGPDGIEFGEQSLKPDVTMKLSGDTCHAYWKKEISLPVALAKRKIVSKGNISKVMKLLPLVKPAFEMYPGFMSKYGL